MKAVASSLWEIDKAVWDMPHGRFSARFIQIVCHISTPKQSTKQHNGINKNGRYSHSQYEDVFQSHRQ